MNAALRDQIVELLVETGKAHHEAFAETDGADPDWPVWYAEYAKDGFAKLFGDDFTVSRLIFCLMKAVYEHKMRAPDSDWATFYADEMASCYAPSESPADDTLALYYYDGCPFCNFVRAVIDQLGVGVELRNILDDPQHRADLIEARGRATVPVLRISSPDEDERWMPESRDIVSYLEKTYA